VPSVLKPIISIVVNQNVLIITITIIIIMAFKCAHHVCSFSHRTHSCFHSIVIEFDLISCYWLVLALHAKLNYQSMFVCAVVHYCKEDEDKPVDILLLLLLLRL
jgi:hypothetical protein